MAQFKAVLKKFQKKGEKTGWTYIEIPQAVTEQLNPGCKKAYRVKGKLDDVPIKGISLTPMGEGNFILAVKGALRKKIGKEAGDSLKIFLEKDEEEPKLSETFISCLEQDGRAMDFFMTLPKGHQRYFSNWIEAAQTDHTKTKRILQAMEGLAMGLDFGEMIRYYKNKTD